MDPDGKKWPLLGDCMINFYLVDDDKQHIGEVNE